MDEIMRYGKGTVCYIVDDFGKIQKGRISGFYGNDYMFQVIGSCGAYRMKESNLYLTEDAARKAAFPDKTSVDIQVQISE